MRWLCASLLSLQLTALAICPDVSVISAANFTFSNPIKWHNYIFAEADGGENDGWHIFAWYAPIDIEKNDLDLQTQAKMLKEINIAKTNVKLKSSDADTCYYGLGQVNIIFLSKKIN